MTRFYDQVAHLFRANEQNAQEELDRIGRQQAQVRELLNCPAYQSVVRDGLQSLLKDSEIQKADHADMLAAVGYRQALLDYEKYLDAVEAECKEHFKHERYD